jgi:hypothetical protein
MGGSTLEGSDKAGRNKPSDLDGAGYSSVSYRPDYSLKKSLQGCSEEDLKTGFKKANSNVSEGY